jgi:hypothetical protein
VRNLIQDDDMIYEWKQKDFSEERKKVWVFATQQKYY